MLISPNNYRSVKFKKNAVRLVVGFSNGLLNKWYKILWKYFHVNCFFVFNDLVLNKLAKYPEIEEGE